MTKTFSQDSSGNMIISGGKIQLSSGIDAVLINCERIMKTRKNEMIYAFDRGVDYLNYVFSSSPNIVKFEFSARKEILSVEGVKSIESFSASVSRGVLSYSVTIKTVFGVGSIASN